MAVRKGRKSGVSKTDLAKIKRQIPAFSTALNRHTKLALKKHGGWWFGKMADQFKAPLTPYGQANKNTTLHTRNGFLKNSLKWKVFGSKLENLSLNLTSDSPYAKIQEYGGVIKAKPGRMMAIPIDDNLTPAGAPKWNSPTNPEISDGFFLEIPSGLYFVRRTNRGGENEDLKFLFAMRKEVDIPGPGPQARRKMKSRLGFRDNALGAESRRLLRRRLVKGLVNSVGESIGGKAKFNFGSGSL